jgi:hypothetical protein
MVRASHFFATSAVTADALTVIDPTPMQTIKASWFRDFGLANMLSPGPCHRPTHWLVSGTDLLAEQEAPQASPQTDKWYRTFHIADGTVPLVGAFHTTVKSPLGSPSRFQAPFGDVATPRLVQRRQPSGNVA